MRRAAEVTMEETHLTKLRAELIKVRAEIAAIDAGFAKILRAIEEAALAPRKRRRAKQSLPMLSVGADDYAMRTHQRKDALRRRETQVTVVLHAAGVAVPDATEE